MNGFINLNLDWRSYAGIKEDQKNMGFPIKRLLIPAGCWPVYLPGISFYPAGN